MTPAASSAFLILWDHHSRYAGSQNTLIRRSYRGLNSTIQTLSRWLPSITCLVLNLRAAKQLRQTVVWTVGRCPRIVLHIYVHLFSTFTLINKKKKHIYLCANPSSQVSTNGFFGHWGVNLAACYSKCPDPLSCGNTKKVYRKVNYNTVACQRLTLDVQSRRLTFVKA